MKLHPDNSGLKAEQIATTFLTQQGLKVITRNFHCKHGEIDIIMQDKDTIVFIEVRLRNNPAFGSAAASIDYRKQQKLIRTAQFYLQQHPTDQACRFDAILFNSSNMGQPEWIRNAIDT
jgi:putative endonuclease